MMISSADIHNAKILIVDDQQADVSLLDRMLLGDGYACVSSTMYPREVCNLYRRNRYDLILLDLKMPGMDGFQVMDGLKEIVMEDYLPVLVITVDSGQKLRALQNGAIDFISKPFNLAEVLARVRNILEVCLSRKKLFNHNEVLELRLEERSRELISANDQNLELESARAMAVKSSVAKSDFLANMSHELRTPLNSVIGFSEVLLDQMFGPINEKQQEYIKNIFASGKHLLSLISDILDLTKVESGKMDLKLTTFLLRDSINTSLVLFRGKALKGGIELLLEFAPEADIPIVADQRKLNQILFNLLSNAVKFTPVAGTVTLSVVRNGDFIEVAITDTGIGIRDEDLPKLFQVFTQLESVYTKEFEGTGLGLALTQQLVKLHGGRVWVESVFGQGSRFGFTVPLTQVASIEL